MTDHTTSFRIASVTVAPLVQSWSLHVRGGEPFTPVPNVALSVFFYFYM
jgi:hypothetical protein